MDLPEKHQTIDDFCRFVNIFTHEILCPTFRALSQIEGRALRIGVRSFIGACVFYTVPMHSCTRGYADTALLVRSQNLEHLYPGYTTEMVSFVGLSPVLSSTSFCNTANTSPVRHLFWRTPQMCSSSAGPREELSLLSLLATHSPSAPLTAAEREKIDLAAYALEKTSSSPDYPRDLQSLDGFWTLLYTTALFNMPRSATAVRQYYDTSARRVENSFAVTLPVPPRFAEVVIGGKFDVESADTLILTLIDIQLKVQSPVGDRIRDLTPRIPLPNEDNAVVGALRAFQKLLGRPVRTISKDVKTTYNGQRIRITRSSGGELRVFCRQE